MITRNIDKLFPGRKVLCCHPYRITRNADFSLDEDEVEDLLKEVEKGPAPAALGLCGAPGDRLPGPMPGW